METLGLYRSEHLDSGNNIDRGFMVYSNQDILPIWKVNGYWGMFSLPDCWPLQEFIDSKEKVQKYNRIEFREYSYEPKLDILWMQPSFLYLLEEG